MHYFLFLVDSEIKAFKINNSFQTKQKGIYLFKKILRNMFFFGLTENISKILKCKSLILCFHSDKII